MRRDSRKAKYGVDFANDFVVEVKKEKQVVELSIVCACESPLYLLIEVIYRY